MRRATAICAFVVGLVTSTAASAQIDMTPIAWPASQVSDQKVIGIADLDGDGDDDVVVAKKGSSVIAFQTIGPMNFQQDWSGGEGWQWTSIDIADSDGNGVKDIVASSVTGDETAIYTCTGGSGAAFDCGGPIFGSGNDSLDVIWFDVDNDGQLDFIEAVTGLGIEVWRQDPIGTFVPYTSGTAFASPPSDDMTALAHGDIDNDGRPDMVGGTIAGATNAFFIAQGPGPGMASSQQGSGGPSVWDIDLGDIDQDGDLDIVAVRGSNLELWTWNGAAFDAAPILVASFGSNVYDVGVHDFDNDGFPDIVVATGGDVQIFGNDGAGSFPATADYVEATNQANSVDAGDLDQDGDLDLVISENGEITMLENNTNAPPMVETCDGIDNDSDGQIDNPALGLSPCAPTEECHFGSCFTTCGVSGDCNAGQACYVDDGRCDDDADPCASITCQAAETCYSGSCFVSCTDDSFCDPANELCYQSMTCRDDTDPCADVQCPAEQICVGGGCFYSCVDDADCDMYAPGHFCFDGRCATSACDGIDCPIDQFCYGGSCFDDCNDDTDCGPDSCYDGDRCAGDPCDGVQCGSSQVCYGGTCFDDCSMASCMDANDACYDDACRDADDPCDGVQCGTTQVCHGGSCFDTCTSDMECDPMSICYENRCTDPDDPWCFDFQCPNGQECYRSECLPECIDDGDCGMDETCHDGACLKNDCSSVTCETGETCVMGVGACFTGCTMDSDCDTGDGEACYGGICGHNMCEAYDTAGIDAYHDNHPFTLAGRRLNLTQYSTPWLWPRPIDGPAATKFEDWAPTATVDPFGLRSVRIVMFLDDEKADGSNSEGKYVLWLTQGRTDAGQGAGEGTFNIRFKDYKDAPDVIYNPNDEAVWKKEDNGVVNIQTTLTNTAGNQTSIGIGHLTSSERNWEMQIFASLAGDLDYLEVYNAETGDTYFLDPSEPVVINNPEFPDPMNPSEKILPESGTPCTRAGGNGICGQGSQYVCRNGEMLCDQTVFPWGFEVCDGKDNTCSGSADDAPIYYPVVYGRQSALSGWNWLPTLDNTSTVSSYMNYTPRGSDDRQGSTAIQDATGAPLQAADKVWTLAHRDLTTGLISVPIVHGVLVGDSATANAIGEQDRNMRLWSPLGHNFDEFFVAWYDDRHPGGNSDDKIPDDFDLPTSLFNRGDFKIKQKLTKFNTGSDKLESDAAVVRPVWLEGATGRDVRFNMRYEGDGDLDDYDDLDDDPYEWFIHLPRIDNVELNRLRSARIKVEARTGDEALCVSNTPSAGNCYVSTYTCTPGGIQCQAGDDMFCGGAACVDSDGDGFGGFDPSLCPTGEDCNDGDPDIKPGAFELCNGIDDDCDGRVDLASNPGDMYGNCPDGEESCGPWTDNPMAAECNGAPVCVCPDGPEDPSDPPSEPCLCREGLAP